MSVSPGPLVLFLSRTWSVPSPVLSRRWSASTIFRPASLLYVGHLSSWTLVIWRCHVMSCGSVIVMEMCLLTFFKADLIGCWSSLGSLAGTVVTTRVGTFDVFSSSNFQEYFRSNCQGYFIFVANLGQICWKGWPPPGQSLQPTTQNNLILLLNIRINIAWILDNFWIMFK